MLKRVFSGIYKTAKEAESLSDMALSVDQVEELLDCGDALVGELRIHFFKNGTEVEFMDTIVKNTTEKEAFDLLKMYDDENPVIYYALCVIGEQNAILKPITEALRAELEKVLL